MKILALWKKDMAYQHNAFSGRRVRQDSAKVKQMQKREKRLRKIGLSVLSFPMENGSYIAYLKQRHEQREQAKEHKKGL